MDSNQRLDLTQRAQKALAFGDGKLTVDAVDLLVLIEASNGEVATLKAELEEVRDQLTAAEVDANETEDECSELRQKLHENGAPTRAKIIEAVEILSTLVNSDA